MPNSTQTLLGSVVALWRYPVKSMMGEELNAAEITDRGLLGDRADGTIVEGLEYRDTATDFARPEGTFFDRAVVHVLTTATLDQLRALYPQGRFEARRFRPNIVVETVNGGTGFAEDAWMATRSRSATRFVGVLPSVWTSPGPRARRGQHPPSIAI